MSQNFNSPFEGLVVSTDGERVVLREEDEPPKSAAVVRAETAQLMGHKRGVRITYEAAEEILLQHRVGRLH